MEKLKFSKWGSEYVDRKLEEYKQNPLQPTEKLLEKIFSCIDLTSLSNADNEDSIKKLVRSVNNYTFERPLDPILYHFNRSFNVAGICVYPKFVPVVKKYLEAKDVDIVSVAGAFPHAQTFREVKVMEVTMAAKAGADEIDVVITTGDIISGNLFAAYDDLKAMREACQGCKMKVILETGLYETDEQIYDAAITAMYAGADFVKTSTGKNSPAATPRAMLIMALAVKDYEMAEHREVGIKPAGGIRKVDEALTYCLIIADILGVNRLNKKYFRIGATSLASEIYNSIREA